MKKSARRIHRSRIRSKHNAESPVQVVRSERKIVSDEMVEKWKKFAAENQVRLVKEKEEEKIRIEEQIKAVKEAKEKRLARQQLYGNNRRRYNDYSGDDKQVYRREYDYERHNNGRDKSNEFKREFENNYEDEQHNKPSVKVIKPAISTAI